MSMPMRAVMTARMVHRPRGLRRRMAWASGAKMTERAVRKLEVEGNVYCNPINWHNRPRQKVRPTARPPRRSGREKWRWRGEGGGREGRGGGGEGGGVEKEGG